jgi:hypothetical protein
MWEEWTFAWLQLFQDLIHMNSKQSLPVPPANLHTLRALNFDIVAYFGHPKATREVRQHHMVPFLLKSPSEIKNLAPAMCVIFLDLSF